MKKIQKKEILALLLIFVIGFALRYTLFYYASDIENINGLTGSYLADANSIIEGHWFYRFIQNQYVLNTNQPKGFSVLLYLLKITFNNHMFFVLLVFNTLIDSLTAIVIWKICDYAFHNKVVGYISALIYAICPLTVINSVQQLPDAFAPFLLAVLLLFWINPKSTKLHWIFTGLILGMSQYFRGELKYIFYVLIFCELIYHFKLSKLKKWAIIYITSLIVLSPLGIYNYTQIGHYVTAPTSAWGSAYEALGQKKDNPWGIVLSDQWLDEDAYQHGYIGAFNYEANQYYKTKFIEYVKTYPMEYLKTIIDYRLQDAFFPRTYAIFNLNRSYLIENETKQFCNSKFSSSDVSKCILISNKIKQIEASKSRDISTLFFLGVVLFVIVNFKRIKDYLWLPFVWGFFPMSISLLKQIEPRNVAPNLVVASIMLGYVVYYLSSRLKNKFIH